MHKKTQAKISEYNHNQIHIYELKKNHSIYKTMNPQFTYYYFNRNSYGTFVDHELDQEDIYTFEFLFFLLAQLKIEMKQSS